MNLHQIAKQGHRYRLGDQSVLAMQSGLVVEVRPILTDALCPLGLPVTVEASRLIPEPMAYFHGETPK